jgi:hypothetical protein
MINNASTLQGVVWRVSSYSGSQANCVEVAEGVGAGGIVPVRDSKNPAGPALSFSPDAFSAFVDAVKAGEFSFGEQYVTV